MRKKILNRIETKLDLIIEMLASNSQFKTINPSPPPPEPDPDDDDENNVQEG